MTLLFAVQAQAETNHSVDIFAENGTVVSADGSIDCGTTCSQTVMDGTELALEARPDHRYVFAGWEGDCSGFTTATTVVVAKSIRCHAVFSEFSPLSLVQDIGAGDSHTCLLRATGVVQCWGEAQFGQVGNGSTSPSRQLVPVTTLVSTASAVTRLSVGHYHSCVVFTDGTAQCWGWGGDFRLGNGRAGTYATPVFVNGISTAVDIYAGLYHSCALLRAGTVRCWGADTFRAPLGGQINPLTSQAAPTLVPGLRAAVSIGGGVSHNCILLLDRSLRCWGLNSQGQLGVSGPANQLIPVPVSGVNAVSVVSGGSRHSCALLTDGAIYCWGHNFSGQLGNGSMQDSTAPVSVSGISTAKDLAVGSSHACAVLVNGNVYCWGLGGSGQLGNGSTLRSSRPVAVLGISSALSVDANIAHSCAVLIDSSVYCWGNNFGGQLGNNSTTRSSRPVKVQLTPLELSSLTSLVLDDTATDQIAVVDELFRLKPRVAGAVSTWQIANQPSWAEFSTATGTLFGIPTQTHAGLVSSGITITAMNRSTQAVYGPFSLTVLASTAQLIHIVDTDSGANRIVENSPANTAVGGLRLEAQHNGVVLSGVAWDIDSRHGAFTIDTDGAIRLSADVALDYETTRVYSVYVRATEGSGSGQRAATASLQIEVADAIESLRIVDDDGSSDQIYENAGMGVPVSGVRLQVQDEVGLAVPAETVVSWTKISPSPRFVIDRNTAEISVDGEVDFETSSKHALVVRAEASRNGTLTSTLTLTISVLDITREDLLPTDDDTSANTVSELAAANTVIQGLTLEVQDSVNMATTRTVVWHLHSNPDGLFAISSTSGAVRVAKAELDYEASSAHIIAVRGEVDGQVVGGILALTIAVLNGLEVATAIDADPSTNTIAENVASGTVVAGLLLQVRSDISDPTILWQGTTTDSAFSISPTTGVLRYASTATLDYETTTAVEVAVQAVASADGVTLTATLTLTVVVSNVLEPQTLSVFVAGSGSVSSSPAGIACGSDCSGTYTEGTTVTLSARAGDGNRFVSWFGDCSGEVLTAMTTVDRERTCYAVFALEPAGVRVAQIVAREHTCYLRVDGEIYCWGRGIRGKLGDGRADVFHQLVPVQVNDISTAVALAAGEHHTCAVLSDGTARCWGEDDDGRLGVPNIDSNQSRPVAVKDISAAVGIGAGNQHSCALLVDGLLRCWGRNNVGQVGDNTTTNRSDPTAVYGISTALHIAVGTDHNCAVLRDGTMYCWGNSSNGRLGAGSLSGSQSRPIAVHGISTALQASAVKANSCAVLSGGTVRCWGSGAEGQLGNGSTQGSNIPVVVNGISTAIQVSVGDVHACAVLADGTVRCWGSSGSGRLGASGISSNQSSPVTVHGLSTAVSVGVGINQSCAVLRSNAVKCWGNGANGRLGKGAFGDEPTPVDVINLPPLSSLPTPAAPVVRDRIAFVGELFALVIPVDSYGFTWEINTQPSWASFSSATGVLYGIPETSDIGVTEGIIITRLFDSYGPFSVAVVASSTNILTLSDTDAANNTIVETVSSGTAVSGLTLSAQDNEGMSVTGAAWRIIDQPAGLFSIGPASGVISVAQDSRLDYETVTAHTVVVSASSGSAGNENYHVGYFTVTISVENVLETLTVADADTTANTLPENAMAGASVSGLVLQVSDEQDALLLGELPWIISSDTSGLFVISSTGTVSLRSSPAPILDYETTSSYMLVVSVSAATTGGARVTSNPLNVMISVQDVLEDIAVTDTQVSANAVSERASAGTAVNGLSLEARDEEDTALSSVTWSLRNDAGGLFAIDSAGAVTVASQLDYEAVSSHTITVVAQANKGSVTLSSTLTVTIAVLDALEEVRITDSNPAANTIAENATNTLISGVSLTMKDENDAPLSGVWSIMSPADPFMIDSVSGVIRTTTATLDYERGATVNVVVRAVASRVVTETGTLTLTITLIDLLESLTVVDQNSRRDTLGVGAVSGTAVRGLNLQAIDEANQMLSPVTWSLSGASSPSFSINTRGVVRWHSDTPFSSTQTLIVQARGSKGGVSLSDSITLDISIGAAGFNLRLRLFLEGPLQ